ncbi:BspA family leucine-rich repeat surface protein [Leyella stercorea]|uniref:BspA family leucine-rich repeat surface protein n=1 Tax=Leyella stercorea TaxID=363265 RepID=UPI003A90A87E
MKTKLLHPIARLLLAILMCLPICGSHAFAQEAESYAVFDKATNTLTFKHDTNKPTGAFALNEGDNAPGWYKSNGYVSNANTIEKVVFDASFANARPTSCCKWFFGCTDLTTIEGIEYLNTENVTEMSGMFCGCKALTMLDVSKFDTKNVQSMSSMFWGCHALTTLDISNFDTQNVTEMSGMFDGCSALTTIYASDKFVTTACKYDYNMFKGCTNLVGAVPYDEYKINKEMANYTTGYFTDIASKIAESYVVFDEATNTLTFKRDTNKPDGAFALNEGDNAPGWYKPDGNGDNTNIIKKVVFDASFANARPTSCCEWFNGCTDLTTIEGIEYLNTENVTDMSGMFWGCYALTTLDVSHFDTQNVTNMYYMFSDCSALTTLDVSNFNTQNVTYMSGMFSDCRALTTLNVSNFNTQNVTDMSGMFYDCRALTTLDVSNFNTQNVTNMYYMFFNCSAITTLDIANFDTKNVTDMSYMFNNCSALKTLDVSNFDTKNVTDMNYMFSGCKALTTLDVSNFDTQNVTSMSNMFNNCSALTTLDVSNFDTKNVTNMGWMFCNNYALTTIYASDKFVTTACEEDENMFAECANLVGAIPYDENKVGKEMANYTTGYFTDIASKVVESYAVFDEATNTLTFKRDTKKPYGAFALNEGENLPGWYKFDDNNHSHNANIIKKVIFDASFANARPTSCYNWFYGCTDLTTIEGIEYLNTENVTNMSWMFSECSALTTLDLSNFDTKNVMEMSYMFGSCTKLKTLDVSSFNTQNVTDMNWMFSYCSALTTLDLSSFETQNVTDMSRMFKSCSALTTIYASDKFVTTACEEAENMFAECANLVGAVPYDENKVGKEMANYTTGYFTDKAATGIDAPTVSSDTAAEYYDLQGRRLNAPQKGVNIVKRGKKTTKVLMK